MNRVDVVDLVVDLVDVGLDIDLVDVDLDVDLVDVGPVDVVPAVSSRVRVGVGVYLCFSFPEKNQEVARVPLLLGRPLTKKMGEDIRVPLGKQGCPLIEILLYSVANILISGQG